MKKKRVLALWAMLLAGSLSYGVSCYAEEPKTDTQKEASVESQVASADEMAAPQEVVQEGMEAIYGEDVKDGTYAVEVDSSSSMFRIVDCELTVQDGQMTAVMTMSGKGYLKLYMGTGEEAVEASEEDYIPFAEKEDGQHTFQIPVEALDRGMDCAAFSKNKEKWYDRTIVFKSSSLPQDALKNLKKTTVDSLGLEDGTYFIDAKLEGGSGRTQVESPCEITVEGGTVTAAVVWGSPYYDYVLVNGEKYEPVNTEGNSAFEIPVDGFDWKMPITADTVAMSTPHEIDYTLYFDSTTIEKAD